MVKGGEINMTAAYIIKLIRDLKDDANDMLRKARKNDADYRHYQSGRFYACDELLELIRERKEIQQSADVLFYECQDCEFRTFDTTEAGLHTVTESSDLDHHCSEMLCTAWEEHDPTGKY